MGNYPIGEMIAEMRRRRGISQEELAGQICSVSTVSKIENGLQFPSRKVWEGLLQRLGLSMQICDCYIGDADMQKSVLEYRIRCELQSKNYENAEQLLQEYEALAQKGRRHILEEQFGLYIRGCLLLGQGRDLQEARRLFQQAITLTLPVIDIDHPQCPGLLLEEEMVILEKLAELYYVLGNPIRAKRIEFFLKEYLEKEPVDENVRMQIYPGIVITLARWMENDKRFEEELKLSEHGLDLCVRWGRLTEYPMLLETKGYALIAMGRSEEAVIPLKQACVIFQSIGDPVRVGLVKNKSQLLFQNHQQSS
jgi:transcriptional regulator with XRE-family HTH domain